ncbi:MAG: thioredoxin [bacterium]
MSDVVEVSDEEFEQEVIEKSEEEKVVVDFWAEWCQPCKMLGPRLEEICEDEGVRLVKVNVDQNKQQAQKYGVRGIPAVKLFKDGELADEFTGVQPDEKVRQFVQD